MFRSYQSLIILHLRFRFFYSGYICLILFGLNLSHQSQIERSYKRSQLCKTIISRIKIRLFFKDQIANIPKVCQPFSSARSVIDEAIRCLAFESDLLIVLLVPGLMRAGFPGFLLIT